MVNAEIMSPSEQLLSLQYLKKQIDSASGNGDFRSSLIIMFRAGTKQDLIWAKHFQNQNKNKNFKRFQCIRKRS